MNSKIALLFFILLTTACGVKDHPVSPKDVTIPSLIEDYPDIEIDGELGDNKQFF